MPAILTWEDFRRLVTGQITAGDEARIRAEIDAAATLGRWSAEQRAEAHAELSREIATPPPPASPVWLYWFSVVAIGVAVGGLARAVADSSKRHRRR